MLHSHSFVYTSSLYRWRIDDIVNWLPMIYLSWVRLESALLTSRNSSTNPTLPKRKAKKDPDSQLAFEIVVLPLFAVVSNMFPTFSPCRVIQVTIFPNSIRSKLQRQNIWQWVVMRLLVLSLMYHYENPNLIYLHYGKMDHNCNLQHTSNVHIVIIGERINLWWCGVCTRYRRLSFLCFLCVQIPIIHKHDDSTFHNIGIFLSFVVCPFPYIIHGYLETFLLCKHL